MLILAFACMHYSCFMVLVPGCLVWQSDLFAADITRIPRYLPAATETVQTPDSTGIRGCSHWAGTYSRGVQGTNILT